MLKMYVDQTEITKKTQCCECNRPAEVLFFDLILLKTEGVKLHLRTRYAKCIEHLTWEDNEIYSIE